MRHKRKPTKYGRALTFFLVFIFILFIRNTCNDSIKRHETNLKQFNISQPRHKIQFKD